MEPTWEYGYLLLNTDPKRVGNRSAMVLTILKDNIGQFEARRVIKLLKNSVVMENLVFQWTTIQNLFVYESLRQ